MQKMQSKISECDCQDILSNYFKKKQVFEVKSFIVEPVLNSVGYLSERYVLKIIIQRETGSEELSFFLKSFIEENETVTEFVTSGNLFNKEIACYKFFERLRTEYPNLDLSFVPKYYYSRENDIIVLEDLSAIGYQSSECLDMDHLKVTLNALAKFHASSLYFEETRSRALKRKYTLTEDFSEFLYESFLIQDKDYLGYKYVESGIKALQTLIDQVPSPVPPNDFKKKVSDFAYQVFEEMKPSSTFRNVWCHGDLWIKNVMYQYKDGVPITCKMFDFQFVRYAPPAQDVLCIIYDSGNRQIYQDHFNSLLKYYLDSLKKELNGIGLLLEHVLNCDEFYTSAIKLYPTIKVIKSLHKAIAAVISNVTNYGDPSLQVIQAFRTQEVYRNLMILHLKDLEDLIINTSPP